MENAKKSSQGGEDQDSKILLLLLAGVGLNVNPRQAGRVRQTEAMTAPELLLRQKKQDQHLGHQV